MELHEHFPCHVAFYELIPQVRDLAVLARAEGEVVLVVALIVLGRLVFTDHGCRASVRVGDVGGREVLKGLHRLEARVDGNKGHGRQDEAVVIHDVHQSDQLLRRG